MAQAAVAAYVHQALDGQLNITPQGTFNLHFIGNECADTAQFIVVPFLYFLVQVHIAFLQNAARSAAANSEDVGEPYFSSFVTG